MKRIFLALSFFAGLCLTQAQSIESGSHSNIGYIKSDGTIENSSHSTKGYIKSDSLVNSPYEFTDRNFYPLLDQQAVLKAILFPASVEPKKRFNLTEDDYKFMYKYMSQMPTESIYPKYDPTEFYPTYCKFLMYGSGKNDVVNPNMRIFNKVGDAYGFLLDNAYIVDFEKGVEFMLTTVLLCNNDQIFNDDKYDYDTIGYPFMKNLGKLIYEHELTRKRKNKADLSRFKVGYDK